VLHGNSLLGLTDKRQLQYQNIAPDPTGAQMVLSDIDVGELLGQPLVFGPLPSLGGEGTLWVGVVARGGELGRVVCAVTVPRRSVPGQERRHRG
jgi:hypothetical protein